MYGFINTCLKSLVAEKFGEDTWEKLRCLAGVQEHFMTYEVYDDALTLKLVQEACCMLDVSSEQVLHLFGQHFFGFCKKAGYDTMLRTLGGTLTQFIENLDALHSYLALSYEEMNAPSFRTERTEDGILLLHYYSDRKGLHHIVPGIIEAVANDFFDCDVSMRVVSQSEEDERTGKKEHVVFEVEQTSRAVKTTNRSPATAEPGQEREEREKTLRRMKERCVSLPERPAGKRSHWGLVRTVVFLGQLQSTFTPCYPDKLWLEEQVFCNNFPFHIVFDRELKVKQAGLNVQRFVPGLQIIDIRLDQYFTIVHPQVTFTIESIRKFINSQFVLKTRREMVPQHQQHAMLKLRGQMIWMPSVDCMLYLCSPINTLGQMIWMPSVDCMLYLCSPKLRSLQELQERGLHLADIAQHDTTRDLILLNQQRLAEMELTNQLERKKEELRILSRHLEVEKMKTETLLYAMLPRHVANQLKDGKRVEAGEFEVCTILFSDVVTFTNICAACEPIHIVHMLNCMYSKFDRLTSVHDVYKVETIGDAYMVVGGVPVPTASHAQRVANFALGMRIASREVTNPVTKQPIQIRVGLHTGPVLAGVVGDKMPRYCLFGDTVNTASRMESHGVPDHIHISPDTYSVLKDTCFDLQERGEIEVKGKGHMTTYFLMGNLLASEESIMGKDDGGASLYQEVLQSNEKESRQERRHTEETNGTNGQGDRRTPSTSSSPVETTPPVPFCPSRAVTPYAWDITEPYPTLNGHTHRHNTTLCHLL